MVTGERRSRQQQGFLDMRKGLFVIKVASSPALGRHIAHAATAQDASGSLTATGGRVLNVTARAASVREAQQRAYAAIDANGASVEGITKADTIGEARTHLLDQSLYPVRINEKRGLMQVELTKQKVKKKELMQVTRQLAVFVKAGIPLTEALEIIGDETTDVALQRTITGMVEDLRNGGTLSGEAIVEAAAAGDGAARATLERHAHRLARALVLAAQQGARVQLIVRGACILPAEIAGITDNIQVRSVIGRFLEHSRVFYFCAGEDESLYLSSADWMNRNMLRRVELAWPVLDPVLRERVIEECLTVYLNDNTDAWALQPDSSYVRLQPAVRRQKLSAQAQLMLRYAGKA